jgi:hypothetical protein
MGRNVCIECGAEWRDDEPESHRAGACAGRSEAFTLRAELERVKAERDAYKAEGELASAMYGGAVVSLNAANARIAELEASAAVMREALEEIAHAPEYDGRFCEDPSDCPNCAARAALQPHAGNALMEHLAHLERVEAAARAVNDAEIYIYGDRLTSSELAQQHATLAALDAALASKDKANAK